MTNVVRTMATALDKGSIVCMASRSAKRGNGACLWPSSNMDVATMEVINKEEMRAQASDSRMVGNCEASRIEDRANVSTAITVMGRTLSSKS